MSPNPRAKVEAEVERLRARVADLERVAAQHTLVGADVARAFLESAAEGVIAIDRSGAIVLVNARTEAMFGYRRGELIGQTLELLLPENVRSAHVRHRTAYFAEPRMRRMGRDLVLA